MARHYFMISIKTPRSIKVPKAEPLDPRKLEKRVEPTKMLISFPLKNDPSKYIQIRSLLPKKEKNQLLDLLCQNVDIFTWLASNMLGIPPKSSCISSTSIPNSCLSGKKRGALYLRGRKLLTKQSTNS